MMTLKDLKEWANSLPEEFMNFSVVNAEEGELAEDYTYRLDRPVIALSVDENSKEILILNDPPNKDIKESKTETRRVKLYEQWVNEASKAGDTMTPISPNRIFNVLSNSEFEKWYKKDFEDFISGDERAKSREEIYEDIRSFFRIK